MKQVLKSTLACLGVLLVSISGYAQPNITQAEYFFDSDPGFGSGTQVPVTTPAVNITSLGFNANVAPLANGMHTLFVRSKNANGTWSITNKLFIAKVQAIGTNPSSVTNITSAEYFYDSDPGFGNGTNIPLTAATNISSLVFNASVSSLSNGMHTLYVRTKDASGWSITGKVFFAKMQNLGTNPNSISNIVKAEYFYDVDPGFGSGTDIPVTASTNIASLVFNANVTSLTNGMHTLYIRTKDAQGKWSITRPLYFAKFQALSPSPNTVSNIVKAEYFYNTDPGFGNGVDVPVTAANDISGFIINASVSSLPTGLHTIFIRTKDAQGKWSITNKMQFSRIQGLSPNPNQLSRINKAEYFYDSDPGFGNGANIPVTPSYNISSLTFNADVSALTSGMHTMYVRTRDSLGQWSMLNKYYFAKVQPLGTNNNTISNVNKVEYYYDTDPGFGNGTDVPVVAANNISSLTFNAAVASLTNGVHTFYVRARDAQGKWSVVNRLVFAKVQGPGTNPNSTSNITRIEYFLDTDPGIGNGSPVSYTAAVDVSNVSFNVDMTTVVAGAHKLYIRSKDAQGKWSITNIHSFNGGLIPLSIELVSFEASLQKDNTVMLKWLTESESDVAKYRIERSYDAGTWAQVGEKAPMSSNSSQRRTYTLPDLNPGTGVVYYKLTEIDLNGKETIAPIRFVNINGTAAGYASVYPNPNDGKQINISSDLFAQGDVTVTIISSDGKIHLRNTVNNATSLFTISGIELAAGNYFINLQGKQRSESLKLQVMTDLQ
jgi:hypothetical protein